MKNPIYLEVVIATRELEFIDSAGKAHFVQIQFGKPVEERDGTWSCSYQITSQEFEKQFRMIGEDSLQSLLLAIKTVTIELEVLAAQLKGVFTWFGQTDLGF